MIVNFSDLEFDTHNHIESPVLVLKTLDGTVIGTLGQYFNLKCHLKFNAYSEVTFDLPEHYDMDGNKPIKTPFYTQVTGMKIVEIAPYGQFVLMKPVIKSDGVKEVKSCTAYSLEYEFNNKTVYIASGTYNFYNPIDISNTVIGIIKELMPNWSIGNISSTLLGKYRTFEVNNSKLYGFMMNDLQKTYGCVFIFDTYTRTIHVRDVKEKVINSPIFLSFNNLIKETEVTELTDELITVLSPTGADPVSIRNVNPLGTNKIYNLDYFIYNGSLSQILADKWNLWKNNFVAQQALYTSISTAYNMEVANLTAEKANLTTLQNQLNTLESAVRSPLIEAISSGSNRQSELDDVNRDIRSKNIEINTQNDKITIIQNRINNYTAQKTDINNACKLSAFFTTEEINKLQPYFIEETLQDSTFVVSEVDTSKSDDVITNITNGMLYIENASITEVEVDSSLHKRIFDIKSGTIRVNANGLILNSNIVKFTMEYHTDTNEYILSTFTNNAVINNNVFASANITSKGTLSGFTFNDSDIHFNITTGTSYITKGVTEYQQQSVELELYNYAVDTLKKLAYPSYEFKIESGNLLFIKEFEPFKNSLTLGNSINLTLDDENIIYPILLEVSVDYENGSNFSLTFSDKYNSSDSAFNLVDLLEQSVSTANNVDFNKYNYSAYKDSGASNQVQSFMNSAIDVTKNAILSSSGQAIGWDDSGFNLRKWNDNKTDYLPQQIRMINNCIAFTDNSWGIPKMAIGQFVDKNLGTTWGIVAPNIAGTLLAGENLVIENTSPQGKNVQFKVDGTGVYLNNARFLTSYGSTQIAIDPSCGIAIGANPLYSVSSTTGELILNQANANLYADTLGNVTVKGTIYANNGELNNILIKNTCLVKGTIQANKYLDSVGNEMFVNGKFTSDYLDLRGLNIVNNYGQVTLSIDGNGNINMNGGYINWNNFNSDPATTQATDDIDALARGEYTKAGTTFINGKFIYSPNIQAGSFYGAEYLDTNGVGRLKLSNDGYTDLTYRNMSGKYDLFQVYDGADGTITLKIAGFPALIGNRNNSSVSIASNVKIPYRFV